MLPILPWRFTLSTFHIVEGIFFVIQSTLFEAVDRFEGLKAEQKQKVKQVKALTEEKHKLEWKLTQMLSLQSIQEISDGVDDIELDCWSHHAPWRAQTQNYRLWRARSRH